MPIYFNLVMNDTEFNMLNDLRMIFCSRKSEVSVIRILVCYGVENLAYTVCHVPILVTS